MINTLILWWENLTSREDELCWQTEDRMVLDGAAPSWVTYECVRRWHHTRRHVWRVKTR